MSILDRFILGSLALGIWVGIMISVLSPDSLHALYIDAIEVDGLQKFIVKVVEGCTVNGTKLSCP